MCQCPTRLTLSYCISCQSLHCESTVFCVLVSYQKKKTAKIRANACTSEVVEAGECGGHLEDPRNLLAHESPSYVEFPEPQKKAHEKEEGTSAHWFTITITDVKYISLIWPPLTYT